MPRMTFGERRHAENTRMYRLMRPAVLQSEVLPKVQAAIEAIGRHDTNYDCDTPEIAEALGYLAALRTTCQEAKP